MNAFNTFPLFNDDYMKLDNGVPRPSFDDILQDLKQKRMENHDDIVLLHPNNHSYGQTWYRWRMGDSYYPSYDAIEKNDINNLSQTTSSSAPTSNNTMSDNIQRQQRDYRRNDEIWIVTISTMTVTILMGFALLNHSNNK
jgi:hypothetical protein